MASIIPGFEYDIFISYRQKDNKYDGWVTEFVTNLQRELEATFKEDITIYFDINPHDGLLETHDVDASLREKLKCLIFIPIISRTYCDPKSFAWEYEFKAFIERAQRDQFGLKIKLPNGNVTNRVLPVRIHDLDNTDTKLFESVIGGFLRSIDFVYKETGVNRQLRAKDDDIIKNPGQILYRDQVNKVALAIRDIIENMKVPETPVQDTEPEIHYEETIEKKKPGEKERLKKEKDEPESKLLESMIDKERMIFSLRRKMMIIVPVILFICTTLVFLIFFFSHRSKVKWAREKALPEIEKSFNELNLSAAFILYKEAGKYISKDPEFKNLERRITKKVTILSDPPGADVYIREYSDTAGVWEKVGMTPIDSIKLPQFTFFDHLLLPYSSYYLVRIEKAGYEKVLAVTTSSQDTLKRKLFREGTIPPGMVYVESSHNCEENTCDMNNGFFVDRYEVTNKQFKEFVDKGGYRNRDYWKNEFVKDGKTLSWEEAIATFTDRTGRPGPSEWEASDYPDGQDDYPVSGVSWYEAAAYSEFSGKSLPTADHWFSASGICYRNYWDGIWTKLLQSSNFNKKGTDPVGKNHGVSCFGTYDIAGNVREWCFNKTKNGRFISGGGYNDPNYMYGAWSQLPPFDRSPKNGFRCVSFIDKSKIQESAFRDILMPENRIDYSKTLPVPESTFKVYKELFRYDSTALDAKIEGRDETPRDWVTEKITFNAAYQGPRMLAYLFLPKNTSPPYQTLIFFPNTTAVYGKNLLDDSVIAWVFEFVLKSGRAILYPAYIGTCERKGGMPVEMAQQNHSHQYVEWLIKWVKDFSRSIDYLETRKDIDITKLGFYGHSWGGVYGGIIPAVEERLKVNILIVGGYYNPGRPLPEADAVNYVPRIKIPTLMLNGRHDYIVSLETDALPFFNSLGTPAKDKKLCLYESDHYIPKNDMVKEVLGWLDKYFGPVK
jgi:eukaryotic-like serine/threonine-protein kinase